MSKIEQLFPELGAPVEKEKKEEFRPTVSFGHSDPPTPDALVLVQVEVECKCGERYISPNPRLLLRFGRSILSIKQWLERLNSLPREVVTRKEQSPACPKCFTESVWDFNDLRLPTGTVEKNDGRE